MSVITRLSTLNDVIDRVEWLDDEILDGDISTETRNKYINEKECLMPLYSVIMRSIVMTHHGLMNTEPIKVVTPRKTYVF